MKEKVSEALYLWFLLLVGLLLSSWAGYAGVMMYRTGFTGGLFLVGIASISAMYLVAMAYIDRTHFRPW